MTTDLRATGLQSFSPVVLVFFGMGMMVERLKHEGTLHSSSDLLEICVKMGVSWSAQDFRQTRCNTIWDWFFYPFLLPEDLAHIVFTDLKCRCGGEGGAGGFNGCVEWCSGQMWGVFPNLK